MRKAAEWVVMDDEYTNEPALWSWGDWYISRNVMAYLKGLDAPPDGYWLCVSSGVEYGPFATLKEAQNHAENVRGD